MSSTHTPGPWTHATRNGRKIVAADGTFVAMVQNTRPNAATAWKNAGIIQAAPDLLAACEFLVNAGPTSHDIGKAFTLAAAALAKAEGGAQ